MAWRGLEEVEHLAATKAHWLAACGQPLFNLLEPFLAPTGETTEWWPDPSDRLTPMRIIPNPRSTDGGLLAVSTEEPKSPDIKLYPADLAVHRLDLPRFGRVLASTLGFSPTRPVPVLAAGVARLGGISSLGLEVILVLPCRDDDLANALGVIRAKIRSEIAVITPTNATVTPRIHAEIGHGAFQHATLGELVAVAANGTLSLLWDPAVCFSPAAGVQTGPPYETWPHVKPPLPNWGNVTIVLSEPDVIRIEFGRSSGEFTSRDIVGFTKRSPGQHMTEAWGLLRRLADNGGTLPTDAGETAQRNLRATRKSLADLLKRFFGINSSPFADNRRAKVWAANFGIRRRD